MLAERTVRRRTIAAVVLVLATTGGGLALLAVAGRLGARAGTPAELSLAIGLLGSLILWRKPSNRIGALLVVTGVLFGVTVLAGGGLVLSGFCGGGVSGGGVSGRGGGAAVTLLKKIEVGADPQMVHRAGHLHLLAALWNRAAPRHLPDADGDPQPD